MTGIILAGGNNKRIKLDKAFLEFPCGNKNEKPLIEITLNKFRDIFNEIIIVTNSPEKYKHFEAKLVKDIFQNKGSLGGIYSGLENSSNDYNFITACDMPFLNIDLMKYVNSFPRNYEILIPKTKSGYETMHAIYSKKCLKTIERNIKLDKLKILDFFEGMNVQEIDEESLKKIDTNFTRAFFNINTKEDYEEAVKVARNSVPLKF